MDRKHQESIKAEVNRLSEVAKLSTDSCLVAILIAAADERVQELLSQKLSSGFIFKGAECLTGITIPEQKNVLFNFDCAPGVFCLINPSFVATVDIIEKKVLQVIDPYMGQLDVKSFAGKVPFAYSNPSKSACLPHQGSISEYNQRRSAFMHARGLQGTRTLTKEYVEDMTGPDSSGSYYYPDYVVYYHDDPTQA